MAVTKKIAVQQMVNQTGMAIDLAIEKERQRLFTMWTDASNQWARMTGEAHGRAARAENWCRIHKYLGYPAVLSVGAILGRFVL